MDFNALGSVVGGVGSLVGGIGSIFTGAENNRINKLNFDLQEKAYKNSLEEAQITRSREDNAIQRRVADLKAAGLSPVLAAGQGAQASQAIRPNAPQRAHNEPIGQNVETALRGGADITGSLAQLGLIRQQIRKASAEADIAQHDANFWAQHTDMPSNTTGFFKEIGTLSNLLDKLSSNSGVSEQTKTLQQLNEAMKLKNQKLYEEKRKPSIFDRTEETLDLRGTLPRTIKIK